MSRCISFMSRGLLLSAWVLAPILGGAPAQAGLVGYDRFSQRNIEVLALVDGDALAAGRHLQILYEDTGEILVVEILHADTVGHDIELEVIQREANHHIIFEIPADGVSEIVK